MVVLNGGAHMANYEWFDKLSSGEQLHFLREQLIVLTYEKGHRFVKSLIREFDVERLSQLPLNRYDELFEVLLVI